MALRVCVFYGNNNDDFPVMSFQQDRHKDRETNLESGTLICG